MSMVPALFSKPLRGLVSVLALWGNFLSGAPGTPTSGNQTALPQASILAVRGRAQFHPPGEGEWSTIVRETLLQEDDTIRTGSDTYLELDLGDAKVAMLSPGVLRLKVFRQTPSNHVIGLRIQNGRYRIQVDGRSSPFFVAETADARIGVKGTDFLVDATATGTKLHVLSGLVTFNNTFQTGEPVKVPAGHSSEVSRGSDPRTPAMTGMATYSEWNVPAPVAYTHPDLVLNPTNTVWAPVTGRETNRLAENAAAQADQKASEKKAAAKSNAQAKAAAARGGGATDPILPPMPWAFQFRHSLQLGVFTEPGDTNTVSNYGYTLQVPGITLPHTGIWGTLTWLPELSWGPFAVGLYIPIIFGVRDQFYLTENWYNKSDWDFSKAENLFNKIVYVQASIWRFTARYGGIPGLTWGGGHLLDGYNNMLEFPLVRVNGLVASYEDRHLGIAARWWTGDVSKKLIWGARAEWNPFMTFAKPEERKDRGILSNFAIGGGYLLMDSPLSTGLTNTHPLASWSNTNHSLDGFGVDVVMPLGRDQLSAYPYLSASFQDVRMGTNLVTLGPGYAAGVKGQAFFITYRAEYYYNLAGYQPRAFNPWVNYAFQRADLISNLLANQNTTNVGFAAELGLQIGNLASVRASFEQYYKPVTFDIVRNEIMAELAMKKGALKGFWASAFYRRRNVTLESFIAQPVDAQTLIGAEAHLTLFGPVEAVGRYSMSFPTGSTTPQGTFQFNIVFDLNPTNTGLPEAPAVPAVPAL